MIVVAKSNGSITPHPDPLRFDGRGKIKEKTFGKGYI
jgi:hypothetical protein